MSLNLRSGSQTGRQSGRQVYDDDAGGGGDDGGDDDDGRGDGDDAGE